MVALPPEGGGGMKVERKHLTAAMQRMPHWSGVVMFIPLPMSCDANSVTPKAVDRRSTPSINAAATHAHLAADRLVALRADGGALKVGVSVGALARGAAQREQHHEHGDEQLHELGRAHHLLLPEPRGASENLSTVR